MKPILKILAAAISSFFLAPLLFAERVLFDVDEWGVPEIRTEGRVFSEGNADLYLLSIYEKTEVWAQLMKKLAESDNPNMDVLVAACADRILPLREKIAVADILLKKYFGDTEYPMTSAIVGQIRKLSKENPPMLNFYLEKFYRMKHGNNLSVFFLDMGGASFPLHCELIRHTLRKSGVQYETLRTTLFQKIRETANLKNQGGELKLAEANLMVDVFARFPLPAKPIPLLAEKERERDSKTLRVAGKHWSADFLSVASDFESPLTYQASVPVLERLGEEGFWYACIVLALCKEESKEWNDAAYFIYLYLTREHSFAALGGLTEHLFYALAEQGKSAEALTLYEYVRNMEGKQQFPERFFITPAILEKAAELEQKCSSVEIEHARAEGKRMTNQCYYENVEFETRFQNALRKRGKRR